MSKKQQKANQCGGPGGKCINPDGCKAAGRCLLAKKPKKPGQVTGQKKGY